MNNDTIKVSCTIFGRNNTVIMIHFHKLTLMHGILTAFAITVSFSSFGEEAIETIVARNEGAVLVIEGDRGNSNSPVQSSGCVVHADGLILTTAHQVDGVERLVGRLIDNTQTALTVVEIDRDRELALLRADRKLPVVAVIGDAGDLRNGSKLISIATPENLDFTVAVGIVANINRSFRGHHVLQAEIAAAPGSSGGPVFSAEGQVVGLIMGVLEEQQWATVIVPINNAYSLLRRNGVAVPEDGPVANEQELLPAPGVTTTELRALEAYNNGTRALTPDKKMDYYRLAVKLLPKFYEAWFNLAIAASADNDYETAREAYERALNLYPDRIEAYRNLGRLHLAHKDNTAAITLFEQAASLARDAPQTYNDLGEAYRKTGRYEDAVAAFKKALVLDDVYANAYYNLAITYIQMEQWNQAGEAFRQYLAAAPDAPDRERIENLITDMIAGTQP